MRITYLSNEKGAGGLLLLVLLLFIVLLISSLPLQNMIINRQLGSAIDINEKRANMVAVSGIEAFIKYLDGKPNNVSRQSHFDTYPGWGAKTITLPEGSKVTYNLTKTGPDTNSKYTVLMTAEAGAGSRFARKKELKYLITVSDSCNLIDPENRRDVPDDLNHVIIGGAVRGSTPRGVDIINNTDIKEAIGDYIDSLSSSIDQQISSYVGSSQQCPNCNANGITDLINRTSSNPVIIKANNLTIDNGGNFQFGNTGKKVILIVDNLSTNNRVTINMYGSLIVLNNIRTNNEFNFNQGLSVSDSDSNLWIKGTAQFNNKTTVNAGQTLYAGDLVTNNEAKLTAQRIIVRGTLNVNNRLDLDAGEDVIAGSITANNQASITCSTGDLFVENNLLANNSITLDTGGYIAVGGNMTLNNRPEITTGGGRTSLQIGEGGGGCGGKKWSPERENL